MCWNYYDTGKLSCQFKGISEGNGETAWFLSQRSDKKPVWDGYVALYNSAVHTVNTPRLRDPVQIKGQNDATDEKKISHSVKESKELLARLFYTDP